MNPYDQMNTIVRLAQDFIKLTTLIDIGKRDMRRTVYKGDIVPWAAIGDYYGALHTHYDRREETLRKLRDAINATPDY